MKTFEQSLKSQKTVKCMIETRGEKPKEKVKTKKNKGSKKEGEKMGRINRGGISNPEPSQASPGLNWGRFPPGTEAAAAPGKAPAGDKPPAGAGEREELTKDEILQKNREEFFKRHMKASEKSRWGLRRWGRLRPRFEVALPSVPRAFLG